MKGRKEGLGRLACHFALFRNRPQGAEHDREDDRPEGDGTMPPLINRARKQRHARQRR